MCVHYRELKNIDIKYKFPIPVIDELLYELLKEIYFTKWIFAQSIIIS